MRNIFLILMVLMMALPGGLADAQNEEIAACSVAEIGEVIDVTQESRDLYNELTTQQGVIPLNDLLVQMHDVQGLWQSEVIDELPGCAFAYHTRIILDQMYDEMLLWIMFQVMDLEPVADIHLERLQEYIEDFGELTSSLND